MTNLVNLVSAIKSRTLKKISKYECSDREIKICRDNKIYELHRRITLGWAAFGRQRDAVFPSI